jgi:predicted DNA binding CopG/RHH family protein
MRKIKLTKQEKEIEEALLKREYADIGKDEFKQIADAIVSRKKNSVLNIRINSEDLKRLKRKAQHFDVRYQTFISELLHRIAQN